MVFHLDLSRLHPENDVCVMCDAKTPAIFNSVKNTPVHLQHGAR